MTWLDAPTWIHDRLSEALPGIRVTPETDATVDRSPCLVWALAVSNPDPRGIWTGNLTLTLLCAPISAGALIAAVHAVVDAWRTPGPLHDVELISHTSNRPGRNERLGQYVFVYSLMWDLLEGP